MFTNVESTELISNVRNIMDELGRRLDPSYVEAQEKADVDGENVIQHKGLKLRKVEREAREGDYVACCYNILGFKKEAVSKGKIYGPLDCELNIIDEEGDKINLSMDITSVFEPIGHCKPVEYEPPFPEALSPNEQRALLIKQAKEFVDEHTQKTKVLSPMPFSKRKIGSKLTRGIGYKGYVVEEQFISNAKKRTVVCLLRGVTSSIVRSKGIAKCAPDDVFNEHIGQAIALARALEIEVPEGFLKAIQPDEKVEGMIVFAGGRTRRLITELRDLNFNEHRGEITCQVGSGYSKEGIILDDTNAEYAN
ncbi:hypothetical protein [Viridibacillus arvi]|uniref:hypothetical protein n=1 Tax=Viridibacillus arvi TaxID=263475 RepID=UPI003D287DD1